MSDDEDDPFERLDESVGDREGDPFERLGDTPEGNPDDEPSDDASAGESGGLSSGEAPDAGESADGRSPLSGGDADGSAGGIGEEADYDGHDVTPADHGEELDADESGAATEDAAAAVEQSEPTIDTGGASADPDDAFDVDGREGDPFDESVFEEMDVGEVDPDDVWESISEAERSGSVADERERTYAEVSKHRYCEQCEFFSAPPDVSCAHEGTEILEFVDHETVRVVDCPVVAKRRELEEHE